jgi:hypothetical protein
MIRKQNLLKKSSSLSINSQIELYNFLKSEKITYMENANGVFFDLSAITNNQVQMINDKLDILQQFENYTDSHVNMLKGDVLDEKKEQVSNIPNINNFEVNLKDEKLFYNIDQVNSRVSKKNNHLKYSVAKKKYNKQTFNDNKKIEDSDLNKLEVEEYTI